MAQITMDADQVKEMCDSAIEFHLKYTKQPGYNEHISTLERIQRLAEKTSPGIGVIWVSDSDMELLSKKLDKKPEIKTPKKRYRINMHKVEQDMNLQKNAGLINRIKKELTESDCKTLSEVLDIPKHYFEEIK